MKIATENVLGIIKFIFISIKTKICIISLIVKVFL
jgi:hypothetical protein